MGFGSAAYKALLGARTLKKAQFLHSLYPQEMAIMREQNGIRHGETEGNSGTGPEHHSHYLSPGQQSR